MITTRSVQSMMNDESLCDDLTTLNRDSSSSIIYRRFNIQYLSQEYVFRSKVSIKNVFIYFELFD
jgi:hypothetical protein